MSSEGPEAEGGSPPEPVAPAWHSALWLGLVGAMVAGPLHVWMHSALPGPMALLGGAAGGALPPLLLSAAWSQLPDFLRRPLAAATSLIGVLLVMGVSATERGWLYVLLRRHELLLLTMVTGLLSIGVAALVATWRRLAAVIAEREQQLAAQKRAAVEAQLRALQAQIRPHFLFNTFTALSELIHDDPDAADDLVTDLAHLLRYSLRSSAEGAVSLAEEIAAIERYLRIEGARLGPRLRVELSVPAGLRGLPVPGLILQPLVENAVQHAVAARSEGGALWIRGARHEETLELVVEDDGPGLPAAVLAGDSAGRGTGGHGGGFANVRRRLELRFGGRATLTAAARPGGGTTLTVSLPCAPKEEP